MATLNIDKDLREALDADRITWAEAGEIRELRKERKTKNKTWDRLSKEMEPIVKRIDAIDEALRPLEAKAKVAAQPGESDG